MFKFDCQRLWILAFGSSSILSAGPTALPRTVQIGHMRNRHNSTKVGNEYKRVSWSKMDKKQNTNNNNTKLWCVGYKITSSSPNKYWSPKPYSGFKTVGNVPT